MEGGQQQLNQVDYNGNEGSPESFDVQNSGQFIDQRSGREKLITAGIIVMAFVAVFFGYFQLAQGINGPFLSLMRVAENSPAGTNASTDLQSELVAFLELQQQDSDSDGLSDYAELKIYATSPYIEDSDSDGLTDKEEVDRGYDPNCPGQKSCVASSDSGGSSQAVPRFTALPGVSQNSRITPDYLRQILTDSGMSATDVADITDAELISLFNEIATGNGDLLIELGIDQSDLSLSQSTVGSGASGASASNVNTGDLNISSINDLQSITGAQLRQMMIDQGAPEDLLSAISDEELKEMFLSKLAEQSN